MIANLPLVFQIALLTLVSCAAVYDWRFRRIPNWLNLCGLAVGLGLNVLYFQLHGAATALEGLALAMAIYLPLYILRGMGAGDVKLMAAVGCLVGPGPWLTIFVATAIAGGAAGTILALSKRRLAQTCWNVWFMLKELSCLRAPSASRQDLDVRSPKALRLPHGVSIAAGCLLFVLLRLRLPLSH